jgi:hypothetical protein
MWSKNFPAGRHTLRRSLATDWGYAYIIQLKPGEPEDPFTQPCHEDAYPWFETIKPKAAEQPRPVANVTANGTIAVPTMDGDEIAVAGATAFVQLPEYQLSASAFLQQQQQQPKSLRVTAEAPMSRIPLMDGATSPGYPMRRVCKCKDGYRGDGVISCNPVDACKRDHGGCASSASCESTGPNTTRCICPRGFNGVDGTVCTKNQPCQNAGACAVNALCFDEGDGIHKTCACPSGFTGDGTATGSGCADINPCLTANGGCDGNARCHKTGRGQRECVCKPGYNATARDGFKGVVCDKVDHCSLSGAPKCDINALCLSEWPGFLGFLGVAVVCLLLPLSCFIVCCICF